MTVQLGIRVAGAFWFLFFLAYPVRELVDDSRYRNILENRYFHFGSAFFRPLHSGLIWLQGALFEPSLAKAVAVSFLLHFGVGLVAWRVLLPRLTEGARRYAQWGLLAFLVHPVAMQTAVHLSQRAEILGALFAVLAFAVYFEEKGRASTRSYFSLAALAFLALLSKEPFALIPFVLILAQAVRTRDYAKGAAWAIPVLLLLVAGAKLNSFSGEIVQNDDNYRRSRVFRESVLNGKEVPAADSIILPLRDRAENLQTQVALVPKVMRIVLLPFGLVKDYGHFPYGRETYQRSLPWLWLGLVMTLILVGGPFWLVRRGRLRADAALLIASPWAIHGIYWIFPIYDPLVLYRLYGVVLLGFVISLPLLLEALDPQGKAERAIRVLASVIAAAALARAWEMSDAVRETRLEAQRAPEHFRTRLAYARAKVEAGPKPVDCDSFYSDVLALSPSASLVEIEWAWCFHAQGDRARAAEHARRSLAHESVPENVDVALNYVMEGGAQIQFAPGEVHPANLKRMVR